MRPTIELRFHPWLTDPSGATKTRWTLVISSAVLSATIDSKHLTLSAQIFLFTSEGNGRILGRYHLIMSSMGPSTQASIKIKLKSLNINQLPVVLEGERMFIQSSEVTEIKPVSER